MKQKHLYIGVSIVITLIISGLVGWSIFIGQQQKDLSKQTTTSVFTTTQRNAPFGGAFGGIANTVSELLGGGEEGTIGTAYIPKLQERYNLPTAGSTYYATSSIRFVDRATGHVFETDRLTGENTRIDQTTTPQTYEAFFVNDGDGVVRRHLDEEGNVVSTYTNLADPESRDVFLPNDIIALAVSPDTQWLAVVQKTPDGSAVFTMRADGTNKQEWFSSSLRGWNIQWRANTLLLTQNASYEALSSSVSISLPQGTIRTHLQQLRGLETLLSTNGETILASWLDEKSIPTLSLYDIKSGETTPLYAYGMARKCVWAADSSSIVCALPRDIRPNTYPDNYYQGVTHSNDDLWKIDPNSRALSQLVALSSQYGSDLEAMNLVLSTNTEALLFKNGTSQSLWEVLLIEPNVQ